MIRLRTFLFALVSTIPLTGHASETSHAYKQGYLVYINGTPSGTETVEERITKDGLISDSTHDLIVAEGLDTKRLAFTTSLKLEKGTYAPLSYSCQYTSGNTGDSYHVVVRKGVITRTLTRAGHTSESSMLVKPDLVIVDLNVFHHFDYLLKHYDLKRGGRQEFRDYIPLIASDISVALTRLQDSDITGGRKTLPVRNFKVEMVGVWLGTASCDSDGRLVRLLIQDKGIEVVRKDLQPE